MWFTTGVLSPKSPVSIRCIAITITAVSYTHLDVYKRQEQNRIIGYTTRNSGGVPENFKNYFAVSYTHLDWLFFCH